MSRNFTLEVKNKGGHSSLPVKDNAIYTLAAGLERLSKFDFPVRLNETTRAYFERMASVESGQTAKDMHSVVQSSGADGAAVARLSESAFSNAHSVRSVPIVRSTAQPITRRLHASRTTARYRNPAHVGMYVISATQR